MHFSNDGDFINDAISSSEFKSLSKVFPKSIITIKELNYNWIYLMTWFF